MNQQEVQEIIDVFADKELSFGCEVVIDDETSSRKVLNKFKNHYGSEFVRVDNARLGVVNHPLNAQTHGYTIKVLGHPAMIGDVLEFLEKKGDLFIDYKSSDLIEHWNGLGFKNSLQQIVENSGFEIGEIVKIRNGLWEIQKDGKCLSQHSMRAGAERMAENLEQNGQERLKNPAARELFNFLKTIKDE